MRIIKNSLILLFLLFLSSLGFAQEVSDNIKTLLSSEGKVIFGNEPNSIVVLDYPENIERVADYLDMMDVMPQQVLIEARVIEVKLQKEHSLGINWKAMADKGTIPLGRFKLGTAALGTEPGLLEQTIPFKTSYYPPAQTSTGSQAPFTLAIFDDNINVVVQMLANALDTSLLSAPRVTTVNNREAEIKVTQSLPWAEPSVQVSDSGTVTVTWSVNFEEVGITLKVTPTINPNGKISMQLNPEVSEKTSDYSLTVTQGTTSVPYTVPIIDKRSASTKVVIGDGQTLIIGGLIKDKVTKGETKVPLFGDIPFLGYMFKSKKDTSEKTELLIFVSPTIIGPQNFMSMARDEKYGIGKDYMKARQDKARSEMILESKDREKQNKFSSQLSAMEKRQETLSSGSKDLENKIAQTEKDIAGLEDTKKKIIREEKIIKDKKGRE